MKTRIGLSLLLMKLTIYCVAQSLELSVSPADMKTKQINFQNLTFEELKAKAQKEKKLVFIDAYTSWCGPCKWMAANVFTNDTVAEYFNKNFINAKIDMERGEGPEIAKKYDVRCYPNFLFLDGDGNLVHRGAGGRPVKIFMELAQNASDPKKTYSYLLEQYASKKNNPEFLLEYIKATSRTCLPLEELVADYFKTQKEEDLTNRANWDAIRDFTCDYKSREFKYLLKNAIAFKRLYSVDSVNKKIMDVLWAGRNLSRQNATPTEVREQAYIEEVKKMNSPETEPALFWLKLEKAKGYQKFEEYMTLINQEGNKYIHTPEEKEIVSKVIYENINNKAALEKAEVLMKSAYQEQPSWLICETYANVLYLLNKKSEAKQMAQEALEIAKKTGAKKENYNSITYLLERIEKL